MKEINNDKKLGRGLSALLGNNRNKEDKKPETIIEHINHDQESVQMLPTGKIIAGIYQPRKHFDHDQLMELSDSVRENGIIQPIIVRKTDDDRDIYEIVAGERRFKAAKLAGLNKVPVIVKNINNIQALEFAIIENVQRADLSPIEEAYGYKQLMNEFSYTQDQVAKKIGCSRSHIANILRLLSLPKQVQDMLDGGKITLGHAKAIMNYDNIIEVAEHIIADNLTVRDVETLYKDSNDRVRAPFPTAAVAEASVTKSKPSPRLEKNNSLKAIEERLSALLANNKVKAEYNPQKQSGKITIFYKDLKEIETLIRKM